MALPTRLGGSLALLLTLFAGRFMGVGLYGGQTQKEMFLMLALFEFWTGMFFVFCYFWCVVSLMEVWTRNV